MSKSKKYHHIIFSASLLVLTITLWVLFAPLPFGGNAAYVIVAGNSMSPKYLLGDLVIVRGQDHYKIGDAITYAHPDIGYVFHRIIDVDTEGHFILQGDNNSWRDNYQPSQTEVIGKLWLHFPHLGKILGSLRSPAGFVILALVFGILLFYVIKPPKKKHARRNESGRGIIMSKSQTKIGENLFILTVLAIGALILGIAAFRQPILNEIYTPLSYEQQALFSYTANVPNNVYDSDQMQAGEPIFRQLNGSFSVGLNYLFISSSPADIIGTYNLLARVSDDSGWKRTLELVPETAFDDNVFTISETLFLDDVQAFIDVLERETGIKRGRYTLSILSEIKIDGSLSELALQDTFSPAINFDISNLEVVLRNLSDADQDVLNPVEKRALTRVSYEQNRLNILGLRLPVLFARWLSVGIGLPAALFLVFLLVQLYMSTQRSELERVRVWYGSMLVEARDIQMLDAPRQVEIASMDDLANLAEQDQRSILHLPEGNLHHFFVQTSEQLYHYQLNEDFSGVEIVNRPEYSGSWTTRLPWNRRTLALQNSYTRALKGWAQAIDLRFHEEGHAEEIAEMTEKLAQALGISGRELEDIRLGAYLHDIGLMNIPEKIVRKKKKLTEKEWKVVRSLPTQAKEHLSETNLHSSVVDIVHYHHERWDGSGYPEGLRGEEIPIGARIVAVIDVWDALKHSRPYRDAWLPEDIRQYFQEQAGEQFDPRVVEVFLNLLEETYPEEYGEVVIAETEVLDAETKEN
ncbi:MAG: signal peptidase I [Chloroflexi bacterium]|nr:signal peptidase I [Chloroflexota bacterium]